MPYKDESKSEQQVRKICEGVFADYMNNANQLADVIDKLEESGAKNVVIHALDKSGNVVLINHNGKVLSDTGEEQSPPELSRLIRIEITKFAAPSVNNIAGDYEKVKTNLASRANAKSPVSTRLESIETEKVAPEVGISTP